MASTPPPPPPVEPVEPVEPTETDDHVLRAISDDDSFRVMVARTTATVAGALERQMCDVATADHFCNLLTGTALIRETMAPTHRVQALLRAPGAGGSLVADTHPDGMTRGLIQVEPEKQPFEIVAGSHLQMMRSMARGKVHRSVVQPPTGGDVSQALMTYLQESEQIVSMIGVGVARDENGITHAGGFVVQLLPGAGRGPLMVMTERLAEFPETPKLLTQLGGSPTKLLDELLYGMPYAQLDRRPVSFGCTCTRETVIATLATLGRDELVELFDEQKVIEMNCDYCRTVYHVSRNHLEGLLSPS